MGRGLSELQKTMLTMSLNELENWRKLNKDPEFKAATWEERRKKWNYTDNWLGCVYFSDVFREVYGWTPKPRSPECICVTPDKFSKKEIGQKKYMAAYIAVRKAAKRLKNRGLIEVVNNNDYHLTEEGREMAAILAKLSQPAEKDDVVELRYLRDIGNPQDGGVWHPKGEIIEVDKENAKRMLTTGIWEVVAPIG